MENKTLTEKGKVVFEGDYATVMFERYLPHEIETVWNALTDLRALSRWFMTSGSLEPKLGGKVDFITGPSRFHVTGIVTAWDPPNLFEHEWNVGPTAELPGGEKAIIRWELSEADRGTILRLSHKKLTSNTAKGFVAGMHIFLDRLAAQLNGEALPVWTERIGEYLEKYGGWSGKDASH